MINFARLWQMLGPAAPLEKKYIPLHLVMSVFGPLRDDPDRFANLAEAATKDRRAEQLFREVAAEMIRRGEVLPPEIRSQVSALLIAMDKRPAAKRGRKPESNHLRNGFNLIAINALVRLGVNLTRNRAQESKDSACSIVQCALVEAGHYMEEVAVEKIWTAWHRQAPPKPRKAESRRKHERLT